MIYRKATLKDLDELCRLRSQLENDSEDKLTKEYAPYHAERDRAWLQKCLHSHNKVIFIAEKNGCICGCAILAIEKISPRVQAYYTYHKKALLVHLYVDKNCRRQGIGRALTECSLKYLAQRGVEFVDLECYMYNKKAAALYDKIGFQDVFVTKRWRLKEKK